VLVAAAGAAGDLLSKHYVFDSFLSNPQLASRIEQARTPLDSSTREMMHKGSLSDLFQRRVFPGVKFTLSTNPGIVFGTETIPRPIVRIVAFAEILLVLIFFATAPARAWMMHVGLAFIISGAVGNLWDRLFSVVALPVAGLAPITNEVRDFIDCSDLHYPYVFNVADVLLVVGVGLIMLTWLFAPRKHPPAVVKGKAT